MFVFVIWGFIVCSCDVMFVVCLLRCLLDSVLARVVSLFAFCFVCFRLWFCDKLCLTCLYQKVLVGFGSFLPGFGRFRSVSVGLVSDVSLLEMSLFVGFSSPKTSQNQQHERQQQTYALQTEQFRIQYKQMIPKQASFQHNSRS